ncbi:hemolysin III family protein [uncultured Abyssibacter sp.]|uniref:PAQR family membrane homeostasis protein TrhA n=1 Tax=uncultured Abyssibacter sp. TaxID=2320202 RepID=UPI0032B17969
MSYSVGEEIAHTITHGLGAVLGIGGLAVLVGFAVPTGDVKLLVGCSVFGATLIVTYTASALYHGIPHETAKPVLKAIDHASIYLLIAGTYPPFALSVLTPPWGWSLFAVVWSLAAVGVIFKVFTAGRYDWFSVALYLGMGWVAVVATKPIIELFPLGGILLMLGGGIAYTLGVVFYLWRSLKYHHAIWHVFVIAGSLLHYFAVLFYVIPYVRH